MKNPVLLMGALDGEIQAIRDQLTEIKQEKWQNFSINHGLLAGVPVIVVKSGVGKVLSALLTQHLIDIYNPSALIFTGIAGSLNDNWEVGDIIAGKDTVQHDMDATFFKVPMGQIPGTGFRFLSSDSLLFETAISCSVEGRSPKPGRILTGDQFITDEIRKVKESLFRELEGDAIDMESASVALVCQVNKIPHLILRTISDKSEGTRINLREFLKKSSENSLKIIIHILKMLYL